MTQQKLVVLLVEDHEQYAYRMTEILVQHGYEIVHATVGSKAIELAHEINPQSILLDMGLPMMSENAFVRELRTTLSTQTIPIIAFSTVETGYQTKRLARALGCDGFINNPAESDEFHFQITTILQKVTAEGK
jgi:CheY-like chemotaxis protein